MDTHDTNGPDLDQVEPLQIEPISNVKPACTYANLITLAIRSSPLKMLTLSQIYSWVAKNFTYFNLADQRWKNAIRFFFFLCLEYQNA